MSIENGKYYICLFLKNSRNNDTRNIILAENESWVDALKTTMQFNSGRELVRHFSAKVNEVSNSFFNKLPKEDRAGTVFIESRGFTGVIKNGVPVYKVSDEYSKNFRKDISVLNKIVKILNNQNNNKLINSFYNDFYYLFNDHTFNYNTKYAREELNKHLSDSISVSYKEKPSYYTRITNYMRKTLKDFYKDKSTCFKGEFAENFCKYMCYYLENHKYNSLKKKESKKLAAQQEKVESIGEKNLQCYKYGDYPKSEYDEELKLVDRENQIIKKKENDEPQVSFDDLNEIMAKMEQEKRFKFKNFPELMSEYKKEIDELEQLIKIENERRELEEIRDILGDKYYLNEEGQVGFSRTIEYGDREELPDKEENKGFGLR